MEMPIYISKLMILFDESFINYRNELILVPRTNLYISLNNINKEIDLKYKIIEDFSRDAYKSMYFDSIAENIEYHDYVIERINEYLGTDFDETDMELIYTKLGYGVHRDLTIKFVESNYDMNILKGGD